METAWKETLLVSLLLAVGAARSVDRPVQLTTDCSAVKADIIEAVQQQINIGLNDMNRTLNDYTKLQRIHQEELIRRENTMNNALIDMNRTLSDYTKMWGIHGEELVRRENIGQSWKYPAYSCREIAERKPQSSSGYYWVQTCRLSPPIQVYCDLDKVLDNSRGWMRVASLDMTDPHQQCPAGFNFISSPRRVCGRGINGAGCSSVTFETLGVQYKKVCGRVIGYQYYSPDAFKGCPTHLCTIDDPYVDGVSITHGSHPRQHVWTYAAGLVELENNQYQCPCSSVPGAQPPSFVGSDYYCESALYAAPWRPLLYADDVLWDGQRCDGYEGACCNPPNLPWFCKDLPDPTTDDLEVRVCADEGTSGGGSEDVPIELVELYIQ